jgi:hypothetical protein
VPTPGGTDPPVVWASPSAALLALARLEVARLTGEPLGEEERAEIEAVLRRFVRERWGGKTTNEEATP